MKLPKTYSVQGGCHNCKWVFVYSEYDEGNQLYCTFRAPSRPQCGSTLLKESWLAFLTGDRDADDKACSDKRQAWFDWEDGRWAHMAGACNDWEMLK